MDQARRQGADDAHRRARCRAPEAAGGICGAPYRGSLSETAQRASRWMRVDGVAFATWMRTVSPAVSNESINGRAGASGSATVEPKEEKPEEEGAPKTTISVARRPSAEGRESE